MTKRATFLPEHLQALEDARQAGEPHYEGPPCVSCGHTKRYVSHGRLCVNCSSQGNKSRYKANPLKKAVKSAEWRAKRDGREFSITLDDLTVPEVCPVLGIPMTKPSLDRKNNELGYTKENTRVISWEANRIKHALTLEQAKALVRYMEED